MEEDSFGNSLGVEELEKEPAKFDIEAWFGKKRGQLKGNGIRPNDST